MSGYISGDIMTLLLWNLRHHGFAFSGQVRSKIRQISSCRSPCCQRLNVSLVSWLHYQNRYWLACAIYTHSAVLFKVQETIQWYQMCYTNATALIGIYTVLHWLAMIWYLYFKVLCTLYVSRDALPRCQEYVIIF